jgi:hypothetical protein
MDVLGDYVEHDGTARRVRRVVVQRVASAKLWM